MTSSPFHARRTAADDPNAGIESEALWCVDRAASPLIGTAIHNGHALREEVAAVMALHGRQRLREEDPFTEYAIRDVPNRVVFHRSRFEVDLNRPAPSAVYLTPEQAWGLNVWASHPSDDLVRRSLDIHASYYAMLQQMLTGIAAEFGHFVLLDLHSYNHLRNGPDGPPIPEYKAPQINIGTISMDRARWAHVVDPFMDSLRSNEWNGRPIDVRENIAFEGRGEQTRFVHANFADSGCAIAIEFKKFFMDEWTGEPNPAALDMLRTMITTSLPVLLDSLRTSV